MKARHEQLGPRSSGVHSDTLCVLINNNNNESLLYSAIFSSENYQTHCVVTNFSLHGVTVKRSTVALRVIMCKATTASEKTSDPGLGCTTTSQTDPSSDKVCTCWVPTGDHGSYI